MYAAFSTKRTRGRWLPGVELEVRTSSKNKSMRITWPDGTLVQAYFTAKGDNKSQVQVQHTGLAKAADVDAAKAAWAERLATLAEVLA